MESGGRGHILRCCFATLQNVAIFATQPRLGRKDILCDVPTIPHPKGNNRKLERKRLPCLWGVVFF
jgi:hypothetical protein